MHKILISLTAAAALASAAVPAAAQDWRGQDNGQPGYGQGGYDQRGYDHGRRGHAAGRLTSAYVDGLNYRIRQAANQRLVSRGEARQLQIQLRQVQPLAWRVETGRASRSEQQRLQWTVTRIERAISGYARDDRRDGRDYGYGYGPGARR